MMEKKIHSSTVVPNTLYIERQADRQIERIVQTMGRPGYVLVARQMGKTNLLLRAIRDLQGENDAFVYIDLSNAEANLRDCFRSIIDIALITHSEKFALAAKNIAHSRTNSATTAPHREHEGELRELLAAITGKLVIVIDEIDALTRTTYSDDLFAKIRSLYMMRAVMPLFRRLTYILSGVADPSDLIKNKALSPFNIGEKIYLDGFSKDEFRAFLSKAELNIGVESEEYLYAKTNGNPRMLVDISSELEDRVLAGDFVSPSTIDAVINKLFLSSFDRPPIDHIRMLLANDEALRSAITVIRYKKGDTLSDDIKRRLYLYGIIGPYDNQGIVYFSNPIIDASISQEWIDSFGANSSYQLDVVSQEFLKGNYSAALRIAKQACATNENELPAKIRAAYLELIVQCYVGLGEYASAIDAIDNGIGSLEKFEQVVTMFTALKAQALWYLGKRVDSVKLFEKASSSICAIAVKLFINTEFCFLLEPWWHPETTEHFLQQMHPWFIANIDCSERTLDSVFDFLAVDETNAARIVRIKSSIIAAIGYYMQNNNEVADGYRKKALDLARPLEQCFLQWQLLAADRSESRQKSFSALCAQLSDVGFHLAERSPINPFLFDSETFGNLLAWGLTNSAEQELDTLVGNMDLPSRWATHAHMLLDISLQFRMGGNHDSSYALFDYAVRYADRHLAETERNEALHQLYGKFALGANADSPDKYEKYIDLYINSFGKVSNPAFVTSADVAVFSNYAMYLTNSGRAAKVHALLRRIFSLRNVVSSDCQKYFVYLDIAELVAYQFDNDMEKQILAAKRVLASPPIVPTEASPLFQTMLWDIRTFREFASSVLKGKRIQASAAVASYPRNQNITVRYLNTGITKTGKYKKLESDIRSGLCVVVSSEEKIG